MFNTRIFQDGLICDDVVWWSRFNKGGDSIYKVDIGLHDIVEGMESNNEVVPVHGAPIGSSVILFDGDRITWEIYFYLRGEDFIFHSLVL